MPFCPDCGTNLSEDTRFCPECGRPLAVGEAVKGKSKKKLAGIIVACAIAIIAAIVLISVKPWERTHTLSVIVNSPQAGHVSPSGGEYDSGEQVTLTASPASGYTFDHWSGDATRTSNPVTITMDSDKSVTATFITVEGVVHPVPGDWIASTGSSKFTFNFTVNSDGTGVPQYTLEFVEFGFCGDYRVGKMTSVVTRTDAIPIYPLPNGAEFSLVDDKQIYSGQDEDPLTGRLRQIRIYWHIAIEGKFDETGSHASGTWEISSEGPVDWWKKPSEGTICEEGAWEASR